jgi:hypothetical protein
MEVAVLEVSDAERLGSFLKHVLRALPSSCGHGTLRNTRTGWHIAYDRYSDALFDNSSYERRVASATMALEALLLGDNDKQELAFKLSMRTARLLSHFGDSAPALQRRLQLAYRLRSLHVHGGAPTAKDNRQVARTDGGEREFVRLVLDATRRALLVSLLFPAAKQDLIASIDTALLSGTFTGTRAEGPLASMAGLIS